MNKLYFGTDGIRGNASRYPFIRETLQALGSAIGLWLQEKNKSHKKPEILIATDTRESCERIKQDLASGLVPFAQVFDAQILPTPAVALILKHNTDFSAGIIISASHNSYEDNGIKIFGALGEKISEQDEYIIETYFSQQAPEDAPQLHTPCLTPWPEGGDFYQDRLYSHFAEYNFQEYTVVLDCAHGATTVHAPALFKRLGINVITIGTSPDGKNINDKCGALALEKLRKKVVEVGADCGFAFDGDGDRVIMINNKGDIRDGDDILYLLAQSSWYQQQDTIIGTVMTNQGLEKAFACMKKKLIRTPVGDKYIHRALKEKRSLLGGEPSGHIIMTDYLSTGDGIFAALRCLAFMQKNHNLTEETYAKFPQIMMNIQVGKKSDLSEPPIAHVINLYEQELHDGRLLVRYSGTENVLRIMTEAQTYEKAHSVAIALSEHLTALLV